MEEVETLKDIINQKIETTSFYILKSFTKKDWKDMGFDEPVLDTNGGWYTFKYEDIDLKFRAKEWDEIYKTHSEIHEPISKIIDLWIEKLL